MSTSGVADRRAIATVYGHVLALSKIEYEEAIHAGVYHFRDSRLSWYEGISYEPRDATIHLKIFFHIFFAVTGGVGHLILSRAAPLVQRFGMYSEYVQPISNKVQREQHLTAKAQSMRRFTAFG